MELNLVGIDSLLNPTDHNKTKNLKLPELDLTGVEDILSKSPLPKKDNGKISFQPEDSDWSLARLSSIEDFYLQNFSKPLPISNVGQGKIHNKWNYDHRASVDIGLNPSSKEGKKVIEYLRENNIPFLAFNKTIQGVSTGPHIHVGRPSHKIEEDFKIGEDNIELNLVGLEEILQPNPEVLANTPELDISNVDNIQAPLDITGAIDPRNIDFKSDTKKVPALLDWITKYNKPIIVGQNPAEVGPIIKTVIDNPKNEKPTRKTLTDAWLNAWNPEYKILNDKFREETGGLDIGYVDDRRNYKFLPNNKIEIQARTARGVQALFEAYKNGGLREYNATNMLIQQQLVEANQRQGTLEENIEKYKKEHPYLKAYETGFQRSTATLTHIGTNLTYIGKAVAVGNYYGWDSQEYLDLINQEKEQQETIAEMEGGIYNPPSFTGKLIAGATQGITSLPMYAAAGRISPAALPIMAYVENLHRGNREAALAALPMAILVGTGRGLSQFTDINPAGSSAPFRRITQKDLSLFQDTAIKGESVSIAQLTPFERQLIHRGANALALQFPTEGVEWSDIAANIVVGLGFPVGKSPEKVGLRELTITAARPKQRLELEQPRVGLPLEKFVGKALENETGFIGDPLEATLEKGFIAYGQAQTVHLDLDTANLNLLELKRALENNTYRTKGDDNKTVLQKQQAIKNAIAILEKAIPEPTKEFFAENEKVIREALKTNYEARIGKENFLKRREESLKPDDIKLVDPETPRVNNLKQSPKEIFGGKAGDHNVFTSQEKAAQIAKDFFKITTQGTQQMSLLPYADVLAKKAQDLSYLGAFYIEDFYRRGIEPTIDLVLNKVKGTLGDYGRYISDVQAKNLFEQGMKYYQSNVADPFFSKLKMDATEKLPARITVEQARNVLSLHKDEFEWTAGLDEFLKANEGKKINKQELIDIIQQGQVRVEESISDDKLTRWEDDPVVQQLVEERMKLLRTMYDADRNKTRTDEEFKELDRRKLEIDAELSKREQTLHIENNSRRNKYSLVNYPHEKLELSGAQNSKEVKLISVINPEPVRTTIEEYAQRIYKHNPEWVRQQGYGELLDKNYREYIATKEGENKLATIKYQAPHWDESNVVAHYRSNDRITTDNQRVYFGEEFQSDWAHDIREKGVKLKFPEGKKFVLFDSRIPQGARNADSFVATMEEVRAAQKQNPFLDYLSEFYYNTDARVEPMPFMGHNWKELVLKRFLRDAAIAKDENGNYKYDGIGWTTARQQLERYGGILEGKHFKWRKNSDGTYTFEFGKPHEVLPANIEPLDYELTWQAPHELSNISLERFAELTTPEAAQEVRDQEVKQAEALKGAEFAEYRGQFSLKEAVELRAGGMDKYGDYDVAYKNIVSKIGKRFGAKYSLKEIETTSTELTGTAGTVDYRLVEAAFDQGREVFGKINPQDKWTKIEDRNNIYKYSRYRMDNPHTENIHYLEITPSMRQSLEKEGLPLFGTGGTDPLKNPEVGIRNILTTREAFNKHRDFLVKSLEESTAKINEATRKFDNAEQAIQELREQLNNLPRLSPERAELLQLMRELKRERQIYYNEKTKGDGTVFNSGLNPDAFLDQAKLLYRGIQDFAEFSKVLIERFGEQVKPYLQDLWMEVKDIAKAFHEDEKGFLNLQLRRMKTEAEKRYRASKKKKLYFENYSIHRGIMLAQENPRAGIVYDILRTGQRDKNDFEYKNLTDLRAANKSAIKGTEQAVADAILIANENEVSYTDAELAAGDPSMGRPALNPDQIAAYRSAFKAEHRNLDKRLQQVLFGYRERAERLNARLASTTVGTPAHTTILGNLLDIADAMKNVTAHYDHLKNTSYISLKRKGPIAAFVQDPAFPIGDKRGEVYQQFNNAKDAGKWVAEQERLLKANPNLSEIHDVNIPQRLRMAAARLTPAQFEDLIDSSGVNPRSPEVEKLRDEVYSRYPSKGYELKRDYVRGYDRTWQFVLGSIADQTEVYANSFYSRVAGEHAIKALEATGLQQDKPDLHKTMQKFIDHEISSPERTKSSQVFTGIRKGVYLFHLGFDVNQLYLNAIAQPITQTYSYFARVKYEGKMLTGIEPEKYWIQAWQLASQVAKKATTGKGNVPTEFEAIRNRLISEGVITPEFNKSLLESEVEKNVTSKLNDRNWLREVEHWAGVFMRAGEKTTRTHAAAEAYLVGKNKFNLQGEELVNFIVRSIDATQTNPSRAEAPLLVRGSQNQSEIRKLLYQFNAFNHMWVENLALNARSDFQNRRISATSRHLIPLAIMGGITGLPLAGLMGALYTLITDKDPKDEFHKYVNNQPLLERLALYGVTGNATLSQKLTPAFPFSESIKIEDNLTETVKETASTSAIPAFATAGQITKGFDDLIEGDYSRAASGLLPLKPLRNAATAERYKREGIKTRKGTTIVPKSKVTSSQLFFQGLGIPPSPLTEYYERKNREKRTQKVKKLRKLLL